MLYVDPLLREIRDAHPSKPEEGYASPSHDLFCFTQKVASRINTGNDDENWNEAQMAIFYWTKHFATSLGYVAQYLERCFDSKAKNFYNEREGDEFFLLGIDSYHYDPKSQDEDWICAQELLADRLVRDYIQDNKAVA